jgi:hypothetical protein
MTVGLMAPVVSGAVPITFDCITHNNDNNCEIGESQFLLDVTGSDGSVNFRFSNLGPAASSIADIYFDWSSATAALSPGTITNGPGVSFSWGASPNNVPGGNPLGFAADLGADSNAPTQPNGVNPGEFVTFNFRVFREKCG